MKCTGINPFLVLVRKLDMLDGVTILPSENVIDEMVLMAATLNLSLAPLPLSIQVGFLASLSNTENLAS